MNDREVELPSSVSQGESEESKIREVAEALVTLFTEYSSSPEWGAAKRSYDQTNPDLIMRALEFSLQDLSFKWTEDALLKAMHSSFKREGDSVYNPKAFVRLLSMGGEPLEEELPSVATLDTLRLSFDLPGSIDFTKVYKACLRSKSPRVQARGLTMARLLAGESREKTISKAHVDDIINVSLDSKREPSVRILALRELAKLRENVGETFRKNIVSISKEVGFLKGGVDLSHYALSRLISLFESDAELPDRITGSFLEDKELSFLNSEEFSAVAVDYRDLYTHEGEIDFEKLYFLLKERVSAWREASDLGSFETGTDLFGYEKMFRYIGRPFLSRHDALYAFKDILKLYEFSGLAASQFYGQILEQVRRETREYPEGTPHHHFNAIASSFNPDFDHLREVAQRYPQLPDMNELVDFFANEQTIFASWESLKRFSSLVYLLERGDVLAELAELADSGNQALYDYIRVLAFHRDSRVDMRSVMQFWRDPEAFLGAEASYTLPEEHDRKKPSNYIHMPNLDLTAEEIRDALVGGQLDRLQAFSPLEIRYEIPLEEVETPSIRKAIALAVGEGEKKGLAKSPKKLVANIRYWLKRSEVDYDDWLEGKVEIPEEDKGRLEREFYDLVYGQRYGMKRPEARTVKVVAKIQRKSDPEAALAGNDTANCMPFGDGKTTLYTFNPNTAQFILQLVRDDGTERTIAQSVLTKDINTGVLVPDIIAQLDQRGGHLEEVLPAEVLSVGRAFVACDNVEVAPNYKGEEYQRVIETVYRDFFREYMGCYAQVQGLDSRVVPIGKANTDALSHLPTEANTFVPQAPVSYSDKVDKEVYMLYLDDDESSDSIWSREVKAPEPAKEGKERTPLTGRGLSYLTYQDALRVGYLEGKAYADNETLMQFLFNMENALIAKDINNRAKDRPNLSLKYEDERGKMRGYLLAWEGKIDDRNIADVSPRLPNQPCVYMLDVATDQGDSMAGVRLMKGFAQLYKQNYLDKGKFLPIYVQAREVTSFKAVQGRFLKRLAEDSGVKLELLELPTYQVGKDTMHPIIIKPVL